MSPPQVQPSVGSLSKDRPGAGSARQQRAHPPSAAPYRLQEASFFGSGPGLYGYPASQAVSQAPSSSSSSSSSHHAGSRAAYSSLGLLHSDSSLRLAAGPDRARYQHHFPAQPYGRSAGAHGCYQFSPRKLSQPPYL